MNNHASPLTIVSNIADFGNDIATLAELQSKLTLLDAKEAAARATVPVIALAVGLVVALGSVPVLLIGLADLIASNTRLSAGTAQLIVGAVGFALALGVGFFGLKGSIASLDSFRRSKEELSRNLSWIRTVLVYSGRAGGRRQV
jgi:hypothetical protein